MSIMQVAKLTAVQAAIINNARANSSKDERQQIKREVFANAKERYGIPSNVKVACNTSGNADQRGYLVLTLGGKRNKGTNKSVFPLGDDGKYKGTPVLFSAAFPVPAPQAVAAAPSAAGSIFGSTAPARWFRLDPVVVARMLTDDDSDDSVASDLYDSNAPTDLPTPNLMLTGRSDLAITADGSIYRKA